MLENVPLFVPGYYPRNNEYSLRYVYLVGLARLELTFITDHYYLISYLTGSGAGVLSNNKTHFNYPPCVLPHFYNSLYGYVTHMLYLSLIATS